MTAALPALLSVAYADLAALGPSGLGGGPAFTVYTGRAPATADPAAAPYVVLGVADTEAEAAVGRDKMRASAPTAALLTANVHGTFGAALDVAAAVQDRWLAEPFPLAAALAAEGRSVVARELAQSLPLPSTDPDGRAYGRRVAVRFTTQPT